MQRSSGKRKLRAAIDRAVRMMNSDPPKKVQLELDLHDNGQANKKHKHRISVIRTTS